MSTKKHPKSTPESPKKVPSVAELEDAPEIQDSGKIIVQSEPEVEATVVQPEEPLQKKLCMPIDQLIDLHDFLTLI